MLLKMLVGFNRLWESFDPTMQLVHCSEVLGDGCQKSLLKHRLGFCASFVCGSAVCVHTVSFWAMHLRTDRSWETPRRQSEKDTEDRRGKDSWYFNYVGWLFCRARLYLKPSSFCSVPLCFHLVWLASTKGNTHSHSHGRASSLCPLAVFMVTLRCHNSTFTVWWKHQMWSE